MSDSGKKQQQQQLPQQQQQQDQMKRRNKSMDSGSRPQQQQRRHRSSAKSGQSRSSSIRKSNTNNNNNNSSSKTGQSPKSKAPTVASIGKVSSITAATSYFPSSVKIGTGKQRSRERSVKTIPPNTNTEKYSNPTDLCCVSMFCAIHRRISLVELDSNKGLFIPCSQFQSGNVSIDFMLNDVIRKVIDTQNAKFRNLLLVQTDRIQLPKSDRYIMRLFYRVEVSANTDVSTTTPLPSPSSSNQSDPHQPQCICQQEHKVPIVWLSYTELFQRMEQLAGLEPKTMFELYNDDNRMVVAHDVPTQSDDGSARLQRFHEYSITESIDEAINNCGNLLFCSGMNITDLQSLYNEYVLHCYPSVTMTERSMERFLTQKLLIEQRSSTSTFERNMGNYFRSLDYGKQLTINFGELIQGMAAFSAVRSCDHAGCIQAKHEYIFRYYSTDSFQLCPNDLADMYVDVMGKSRTSETLSMARLAVSSRYNQNLTFEQYMASEFAQQIEPLLRRLTFPIRIDGIRLIRNDDVRQKMNDQRCERCTRPKFYHSMHMLSLTEIGEVGDITKVIAPQIPSKEFKQDLREGSIHVLASDLIDRIKRFAMFMFNSEEMGAIRNVENWFYQSKSELIDRQRQICAAVEEILANEPRVLELNGPCYVFGDIHGNLRDLLSYGSNLWRTSPFANQATYLFLGDYVDRGQYGVEVIIYLFCMKILAPRHFFFLRGNHEIREVQEQFSFSRECTTRFTDELWDAINLAFDRLPIAAVIDDSIYGSHGGIPASVGTLDQIRCITTPLDNPLLQAPESWQILWNDPISNVELRRQADFDRSITFETSEFIRNTKRGTALLFTELATRNFLKRNMLQYLIRAHEVFQFGYQLHHCGLVLSIFSSSHYMELNNRASVLFFNGSHIRVIRINTDD